jgi:hypothetical protein
VDRAHDKQEQSNRLRHRGACEEAESMFREVLRIRRTLRGAENEVDIAYTRYHLGLLLLDREDYSGAGENLQQTIAGFRKYPGQEHPLSILATAAHAQALGHKGSPPRPNPCCAAHWPIWTTGSAAAIPGCEARLLSCATPFNN